MIDENTNCRTNFTDEDHHERLREGLYNRHKEVLSACHSYAFPHRVNP